MATYNDDAPLNLTSAIKHCISTASCTVELHARTQSEVMAKSNRQFDGEQSVFEDDVYVSLTYEPLDATDTLARVKSPKAGAVVLFAGM